MRLTAVSSLVAPRRARQPAGGIPHEVHPEVSEVLIKGDGRLAGLHNADVEGPLPSFPARRLTGAWARLRGP